MNITHESRWQRWTLPLAGCAAIALSIYGAVRAGTSDAEIIEHVSRDGASKRTSSARARRGPSPAANRWRRLGAHPRPGVFGEGDHEPHEVAPEASYATKVAEAEQFAASEESKFVEAFAAESVGGEWAATWERRITHTLETRLGQLAGFDGISVECRTERCVGIASWATYEAATKAIAAAANATQGRCATFVFMPPPDDPHSPYTHKLRFASCRPDPA